MVEMLTFSVANSRPSALDIIMASTPMMAMSPSVGKTPMMKSQSAT